MNNKFIHKEFFRMLAQDEIGAGVARVVFDSGLLPDMVIKCEEDAKFFQNVAEWQVWEAVKDTEYAKWFAPCVEISPCGSVLIQQKTTEPSKYPEKLPAFLTDTKRSNYGMLGGRFVCHDYGKHLLMEFGMNKRLRKVDWWD